MGELVLDANLVGAWVAAAVRLADHNSLVPLRPLNSALESLAAHHTTLTACRNRLALDRQDQQNSPTLCIWVKLEQNFCVPKNMSNCLGESKLTPQLGGRVSVSCLALLDRYCLPVEWTQEDEWRVASESCRAAEGLRCHVSATQAHPSSLESRHSRNSAHQKPQATSQAATVCWSAKLDSSHQPHRVGPLELQPIYRLLDTFARPQRSSRVLCLHPTIWSDSYKIWFIVATGETTWQRRY